MTAIKLYHQCLLHTQAVHQLTKIPDKASPMQAKDESKSPKQQAPPTEQDRMNQEADSLSIKCYNNLAACLLNSPEERSQKDYLRMADYCDKVLQIEPNNEKAIFRKGMALARATLYDKAIDVLKKCPANSTALCEIARCERALVEDRKQREEVMRKNFAKNAKKGGENDTNNAAGDAAAAMQDGGPDEKENHVDHEECCLHEPSTSGVECNEVD